MNLQKKVGYTSRSSVAKVETNANGMVQSKVIAFAKALHTTPAYLMGWVENEETEKKNDTITDIILKLRSDSEFLEVVTDIYELPKEQLNAVNAFLTVLKQQNIN